MKNTALLVRKDFLRKWKNPAVIIGFSLIPVVFTVIFGLVFGESEESILPPIKILAADEDNSIVSNLVLSAMSQGEMKKMVDLSPVDDESAGRRLLNRGKASAVLVIPKNFGRDVLEGRPSEIRLLKNPSEQFLPTIAEEIVDTTTLLLSGLLTVFGDEIETIRKSVEGAGMPDADIAALSVQIRRRLDGVSKYVFPPVISIRQATVDLEQAESKNTSSSWTITSYVLPAMAILFLMFICNVVFEDLLRERESGTLLRLSISPMTISEFIWSKIIASALIGLLTTLVLIALGAAVFSIRWGPFPTILLVVLCLNILIAGFIAFLYTFVHTERQAGAIIAPVILVMSLLGGSMMPVSSFPPFFQNMSKLTVNYWGLEAIRMNMEKKPFLELVPIMAGMLAAGVILSLVAARIIRSKLHRGLFN